METHTLPKLSENTNTKTKTLGKKSKLQTKALGFWDSVQTKGANKVYQEGKYRAELRELRKKVGMNVVNDYIFGNPNSDIVEFLEERNEIVKSYDGKLPSSGIKDNGDYEYSDSELEEIELIKSVNF